MGRASPSHFSVTKGVFWMIKEVAGNYKRGACLGFPRLRSCSIDKIGGSCHVLLVGKSPCAQAQRCSHPLLMSHYNISYRRQQRKHGVTLEYIFCGGKDVLKGNNVGRGGKEQLQLILDEEFNFERCVSVWACLGHPQPAQRRR